MDDSIFARLGYDPVRIHGQFHGRPAAGGIARIGGRLAAEPAGPPGDDPAAPAPASADDGADAVGHAGGPVVAEGPALAAGAPVPPPAAAPQAPLVEDEDDEDDLAYEAPLPSADMHAWLVHNWDAIKALESAGQLPELTPPSACSGTSSDGVSPPPAPPVEDGSGGDGSDGNGPEGDGSDEPGPEEAPPPYLARGDRWTKWKMAEFLRQLAATHSVTAAAKEVGMSRNSAYKLRARLKGQPFDIAWEAAFRHGYDDLAHAALELALEGEEVPHYYQGELMGTHRRRNPQLIIGLLRMRNRAGAPMLGRYGAAAEFWSERWEQMMRRVETGSVTWDDERRALGEAGLAQLEPPDAQREADLLVARNRPDERVRRGAA